MNNINYLNNIGSITTIILAAGKGSRMNCDIPKVLVKICDKPMIEYVIDNINPLSNKIIMIVGYKSQMIKDFIENISFDKNITFVNQEQQLGTGHAVLQAKHLFNQIESTILVMMGDAPLITTEILNDFINYHKMNNNYVSLLTTHTSYENKCSRILRDQNKNFKYIIEAKDINDSELWNIDETSTGTFLFESKDLFSKLEKISNNNSQHEYYLGDVLNEYISDNIDIDIGVYKTNKLNNIYSANTVDELNEIKKYLN